MDPSFCSALSRCSIDDDEISLSARILEQEHLAYPEAIARVLSRKYAIIGRRYVLRASQEATLGKEMR